MKRVKYLTYVFLTIVLIFISLITFVSFVSPYPASNLLKYAFTLNPYEVRKPEMHQEVTKINYKYDNEISYDLIYDETSLKMNKTILWIRGGGFVGGYKEDVEDYLYHLVKQGYTVINMDYSLAPNKKHPYQIIQIGMVINHVSNLNNPNVNLDKLIIGGDSAGAHMALNFVTNEINDSYNLNAQIKRVLNKNQIKGLILFSGIYDFFELRNNKGIINNYFIHKMGWAYTGKYNWLKDDELLTQATLSYHITKDFPNVYITDGNDVGIFDFLDSAIKLSNVFESLDVKVSGVLDYNENKHEFKHIKTFKDAFDLNDFNNLVLGHNYAFRLDNYYTYSGNKTNNVSNGFSPGNIILNDLLLYLKGL